MKTVIIRNAKCNHSFDIVTLVKHNGAYHIADILKKNITLEQAQQFMGVDPDDSFIDSEGDKIK